MQHKCLYCYEAIDEKLDFHSKCSQHFFGTTLPPVIPYSINQLDELALNVVERSIAIPGVQAKLSLSFLKDRKAKNENRLTVVGALGGNFILKPPSQKFQELPQNEHLTMRIAEAMKINVVSSSLIRLASGELCYITKRLDRTATGEKIHMLDMFQITEAFDKYKSSLEKVGNAIQSYSASTLLDKIYFFELVLLCFLTGSNDMHLKNFSMIKSPSGWILAPAYDLLNVAIVLNEDKEELALSLEGKEKKLKKAHFISFGKRLQLSEKQIVNTFQRMIKNKTAAFQWIQKSFLSETMKKAYQEIMESRFQQLEL